MTLAAPTVTPTSSKNQRVKKQMYYSAIEIHGTILLEWFRNKKNVMIVSFSFYFIFFPSLLDDFVEHVHDSVLGRNISLDDTSRADSYSS